MANLEILLSDRQEQKYVAYWQNIYKQYIIKMVL